MGVRVSLRPPNTPGASSKAACGWAVPRSQGGVPGLAGLMAQRDDESGGEAAADRIARPSLALRRVFEQSAKRRRELLYARGGVHSAR